MDFQNLTTYQSVILVNPTLIPTNLSIGVSVFFPIFCQCPTKTQVSNGVNYLVSYVFQPSDDLSSIASRFGVQRDSIIDVNGNRSFQIYETIFIPVQKLPVMDQPLVPLQSCLKRTEKKIVVGLATGAGIAVVLLFLVVGIWGYRERELNGIVNRLRNGKALNSESMVEGIRTQLPASHLVDVADCVDKIKVFRVEELKEATDEFSDKCLIQGSVYFGAIDGEFYAIKKMKWDASKELKILQKVNHGNLVKLEGFCSDLVNGNCYLVYEFIENGSLHSWIHGGNEEKLNWKTRLQIAMDVANGILYIHEHTRPRVVHKNIKSRSILLDSNMRAKIANFGLSKSGCNAVTMHQTAVDGYIAPEFLASGEVSPKMDVFSFGVVLLELVSGREAIGREGSNLVTQAVQIFDGDEEMKLEKGKAFMDAAMVEDAASMDRLLNVVALAVTCLQKDPSKRPNMVDIVYALSRTEEGMYFNRVHAGLSEKING